VSHRHLHHDVSSLDLGLRKLSGTGRWLLIVGFVPAGNAFVASALVTALAGASAMGYAEAARTVAQPVLVLGIGLLRVLGPRSMESALAGDRHAARHTARVFRVVMVAGAVVFLAGTAVPWDLNLFWLLVPKAYVVPGLVALMVVANLVIGLALPERAEMLGSGMARKVASREYVAIGLSTAAATSATAVGSYAWPLSRLLPAMFRSVIYHHDATAMYRRFDAWGLAAPNAGSAGGGLGVEPGGGPPLLLEQRVERVVDPSASDQQLLAQDALPGESELLGDTIAGPVADGDPQVDLVEAQVLEAEPDQPGRHLRPRPDPGV
jgi:hypothetical protein